MCKQYLLLHNQGHRTLPLLSTCVLWISNCSCSRCCDCVGRQGGCHNPFGPCADRVTAVSALLHVQGGHTSLARMYFVSPPAVICTACSSLGHQWLSYFEGSENLCPVREKSHGCLCSFQFMYRMAGLFYSETGFYNFGRLSWHGNFFYAGRAKKTPTEESSLGIQNSGEVHPSAFVLTSHPMKHVSSCNDSHD